MIALQNFNFKDYSTTKCAAAMENLKTNYTFFVKPTSFLLFQGAKRSMTNFSSCF